MRYDIYIYDINLNRFLFNASLRTGHGAPGVAIFEARDVAPVAVGEAQLHRGLGLRPRRRRGLDLQQDLLAMGERHQEPQPHGAWQRQKVKDNGIASIFFLSLHFPSFSSRLSSV